MSAEKLRGWFNPGWLTPAYRQSLLSLVRSNGNQQLVETNRNSIKYAHMMGKSSNKGIFAAHTASKPMLHSRSHCSWNANHTCLKTAFVQQQHHCSCLRELQCYRYNNSVCCVYCMGSILTLLCYCKQAHVFGRCSNFLFFFLLAESSAYVNVSLYSLFGELEVFLPLSRLPFQTETFSLLCELGWNKIRLLKNTDWCVDCSKLCSGC